MENIKVIAEIGCNHKGEMEIAKQLIDEAIRAGANVAKFQKRNNKELLSEEQYNAPHPNPINSYGETYGEHREYLELTIEQHLELKEYCESKGIEYSTSVWDMTSAKEIASLNPKLIKIPSAMNNHYELLKWLCDNYNGEIHISTGMTNYEEIERMVEFFTKENRNKDVVIYNCTSGYPVPYKDICLLELTRLQEKYKDKVKAIGFSGHHLGTAIDIAAYTLGAEWIERHFTIDKTWKGTDHGASLEPLELETLVKSLKNVKEALTYKKSEVLEIELVQKEKLKFKPQV
ncbi:N-acetylneuraminate synthase family protein [Lysinibacillus sp. 1 U-2021]|uniref:N-acetylneuraminate synthase family protein n=1 Tax=Lysinibacillus sp. 1 U-2021 TaxID=3039426 RepID=UPI0024800192|nr:N-acetylneuraminate synthase family protein [Lysinibacillus sp. 1 U-2021]WGT40581.1 N-acetylneuraminate synthase family protein [Lysinibacillus sp. 1 U-2021]